MLGKQPAQVAAVVSDATHGYGAHLSASDLHDLGMFLTQGQLDMDALIDGAAKAPKQADATQGGLYYATLCAQCHGKVGIAKGMPIMGKVANSNPWETLHKIQFGQPGAEMPALLALDMQISLDILAHLQTLPQKK
ncbi:putative Cytochrome c, class I [Magnetofaba australis IT-1]|uniref:Putative Cytochrome c, class I n=2 Tax=Magnetofaba TaxID=1472292 RepID=A0A1Y2K931_9PROT|nr:putative Cytochrome c, class I [Magnetofaba australis IT-1]